MFDSDFGYNIFYIWEYCPTPSQVTQKTVSFEWDSEKEGALQWTQASVQTALLLGHMVWLIQGC